MSPRQQCLIVFASLLAILTVASGVAIILRRRAGDGRVNPGIDNLVVRIRAWWIMVLVMGIAILAGRSAVVLIFAFLSLAALREFITLTPTRRADHSALLLSFFVVVPIQYALIWTNRYGLAAILIPVYALLILPVASAAFGDTSDYLARTAEIQWGLLVCVFSISHVPALLNLEIPGYSGRAILLVVFLLVVTQSSDVLQYIFGKLFGRRRIAPSISPGKTVEGLIGGVTAATAIGALLWRMTPFDPLQAAGLALISTTSGFLGGLVMSAIKRDRDVKNWGQSIAGHGGVLDRLDSVAFAAPVFFHLTKHFFAS